MKIGKIKVPKTCFDCGKLGGKIKYGKKEMRELVADHYKGYSIKNAQDVQFICRVCSARRDAIRLRGKPPMTIEEATLK